MKRPPHFEIRSIYVLWYFRIVAGNGKILARSEVYERIASAKKACRAINPKLEIRVINAARAAKRGK